jgi:hypothetical protein
MGDADEHSDIDFLIVTERPVTEGERAHVQALHPRLYALPVAWAQHLEGSYAPRGSLHRVNPKREPFFFLDHGASELGLRPPLQRSGDALDPSSTRACSSRARSRAGR